MTEEASMSEDRNKELIGCIYEEVINAGDLERAGNFVATDVVEHTVPGLPPGLDGFKAYFSLFKRAFPDARADIEEMAAEGDKVWIRSTLRGTHQDEFLGMPATGKSFEVGSIDIMRVLNGKCVEHWGLVDQLSLMQQLGLVPA